MKFSVTLFLLACIAIPAGCMRTEAEPTATAQVEQAADISVNQLEINGDLRTYRLHAPSEVDTGRLLSLVIVLHGLGDDGERMEEMTEFSRISETEGVVVVYPDGLSGFWPGVFDADFLGDNSDVEFVENLIEELQQQFPIDERRQYAAGFSNGAFFAFDLACNLSDTLAAIGLVAGATTEWVFDSCDPAEPVSYLAIHGTDDPVVPFKGGNLPFVGGVVSAETGAQFWAEQAGCDLDPQTTGVDAETEVARMVYQGCERGYGVELQARESTGHVWSDDEQGRDTTAILWNFFKRHPKP